MTVRSPAVSIDGTQGGGQLLRTALSLAALRQIPVEVHSVRARRRNPGLQPQHLAAVRALAEVCRGRLEGDAPGSQRVALWPGTPQPGEFRFEVGTAGAATLVLQAVLPLLAQAGPSRVHITGGTHVPWSPPADYTSEVLFPLLGQMGLCLGIQTGRWGFYPQGGGELVVDIAASGPLRPLTRLRRQTPFRLCGVSAVSRLPRSIAERQRDQGLRRLQTLGYPVELAIREVEARDPGSFFFVLLEDDGPLGGFSALGRRGVPAEQVADEAVEQLLAFIGADAGCDPCLADQLIVPMALADGTSRLTTSRVTAHLLTVLDVVRQLLGCPVHLDGEEGAPGQVTLEGCGGAAEAQGRRGAEAPGRRGEMVGNRNAAVEEGAAVDAPLPLRASAPLREPGIPHSAFRIPHLSPSPPAPSYPPAPARIRKAHAADVPAMQRLLAHFASRGDLLPRTLNEMYQHLRDFFVCERDGEIVGLVALFLYWEDLAEVRSLAVRDDAGGQGLGKALVQACLDEARHLGVRRVFALTNRPGFFERLGFRVVDKRELPQKIWKDCIRCAKFAACDETALIREAEDVRRKT